MNRKIAVLTFVLVASSLHTHAQDAATGGIAGILVDASGARVTQGTIIVTATNTNASRTATTDGKGEFRIPLLPPGSYSVSVAAPGFTSTRTEGVEVIVSETTALNLSLSVQADGSTIEVDADSTMAQFAG